MNNQDLYYRIVAGIAGLWLFVALSFGAFESLKAVNAVEENQEAAHLSEIRMHRVVPPRINVTTSKCSLEQSQRIWQIINHEQPHYIQPGLLIAFQNTTAFYDGKEWSCNPEETKLKGLR